MKTLLEIAPVALLMFSTAHADTATVKADLHGIVAMEAAQGNGTGIILKDSIILTNSHVIHGSPKIYFKTYEGHEYKAHMVFENVLFDIAEIQPDDIAAFQRENSIHEMKFATSYDTLDQVYSLANPLSVTFSISEGHIMKALHRYVDQETYNDFRIATDAKVLHGSSGGALVNTDGDLIGMNRDGASDDKGMGTIGMSIPMEIIQKVLDDETNYKANMLLQVNFELDEFAVVSGAGNGLAKDDKLVSYINESGQEVVGQFEIIL